VSMFAARLMDDASTSVNYRRRFSLLFGPWRTSSRVVAVLVLLFLVFCNVPGQEVARLRFGGLPPLVADMDIEYTLEHGWPFSFATRTSVLRKSFGPGVTVGDCFRLWSEVDRFRPAALLTNGGIALFLAGAIGAGFEAWRRARNRWQVHLLDLCAIVSVLSVAGAWYLHERRLHGEQEKILHPGGQADQFLLDLDCTYQQGGFTWLRIWLGDKPFEFLDRPRELIVSRDKGWSQLSKLPTTRSVDGIVPESTDDLRIAANLPNLEALWLDGFDPSGGSEQIVELPAFPRLIGLHLSSLPVCRGIDRSRALEVVKVSESKVDDRMFQEISRLPELRELSLDAEVTADRLLALSSLPELRALELQHVSLDASGLRAIGRFRNLTYLELWGCSLAEGELKEVASLPQLQTLRLPHTKVASQDLALLVGLPLKELYLGGTQVDSQAIPHLVKLVNLRELVLPSQGFSLAEEKLLRERLPKCQIHLN
jgi:hypothetical protein